MWCPLVRRRTRDKPLARPSAKPKPPPTTSPAMARRKLTQTFSGNSPDSVSRQAAFTTASGDGRKDSPIQPNDDAPCQRASNANGNTHAVPRSLKFRRGASRVAAADFVEKSSGAEVASVMIRSCRSWIVMMTALSERAWLKCWTSRARRCPERRSALESDRHAENGRRPLAARRARDRSRGRR